LKKLKTLQDVYDAIPELECKGQCQESCGIIPFFPAEAKSMAEKGIPQPRSNSNSVTCSALQEGRCSIYPDRPFICRLWGNVPKMACPWGCKPLRYLTAIEERRLIIALHKLSKGEEETNWVNFDTNPLELHPPLF